MKTHYKLIFLTIVAIFVSITLKVFYEVDYYVEELGVKQDFNPTDYFGKSGFKFEPFGSQTGLKQYIGMKGNCLIIAGLSDRDGNADAFFEAKNDKSGMRVAFLYENILYKSAPYFRSQFDHYLQMLKVAIGQKPVVHLILHLAITPSCTPKDFAPIKVLHKW